MQESQQNLPEKKVKLNLLGLNGNVFSLNGAFRRQARREGWSAGEIEAVTTETMSGDYDHALQTLIKVTK